MWCSVGDSTVADALRQSLKLEAVTQSAGQPVRGKPLSENGQTTAVGVVSACNRLGLIAALCAGATNRDFDLGKSVIAMPQKTASVINTATEAIFNTFAMGTSPTGAAVTGGTIDTNRGYDSTFSGRVIGSGAFTKKLDQTINGVRDGTSGCRQNISMRVNRHEVPGILKKLWNLRMYLYC